MNILSLNQPLICCIHTCTMSYKWKGPKMFNPNGINSHFLFLRESLCISISCIWFIYWHWFGRGSKQTDSCLCLPSVSAWAQPALHTHPKRSTLSPRRPPPLKRRRSMISPRTRGTGGMTNASWRRGNLWQVGWLPVISRWAWKDVLSPESKSSPSSSVMSLMPFTFRGVASLWIVSLSWAWGARGGEVMGGASGAAGEGDAGGQADGVSPAGEPRDQKGQIWP